MDDNEVMIHNLKGISIGHYCFLIDIFHCLYDMCTILVDVNISKIIATILIVYTDPRRTCHCCNICCRSSYYSDKTFT